MTKRKKLMIWVSGLVLIFGIIGSFFFFGKKLQVEYLTEEVRRGTLSRQVSVTGKMVSQEEINLNFETTGRVKEIKVYVGKEVVKGEILATIEDGILSGEVEKARLNWEKVLAEAGGNFDAVQEAERTVKNAEKYLEEMEDLDDKKEKSAEKEVEAARKYYNDILAYYNQIVDDNGVDSIQAKSAKITLTTAENNLNSAKNSLEVIKKTSDVNKVSAKGTLDSAKDKLRTIRSEYAQKSRNASVQSAKVVYDQALLNLEKTALKAPVSGIIGKVNYKKGEVLGTSSLGNSFGRMITKDFILEVDVPESDVARVKIGQTAEIDFDALDSEEKFQAKVIEIEPVSNVVQEVVYYKVKLSLENYDNRLKEGMSFDADIKISQKDNVLIIPKRALINGGSTVRVLLEDGISVKEVKIEKGMEGDDGLIEVISGLKEKDKVVVLEKSLE